MTTPNDLATLRAWWDKYTSKGWVPVAVAPNQKAPRIRGWQRQTGSEEDWRHVRAGSNLGVLIGEPSSRHVDVDLDAADSLEMAPHFLPPTGMKAGRTGRPSSQGGTGFVRGSSGLHS